jgi:hypothetical protein
VRVTYSILVALFWVPCIALLLLLHSTAADAAIVGLAVLNAVAWGWALHDAEGAIRRTP